MSLLRTFQKPFNIRLYSTRSKTFFVSTPIFYVNASPHVGHLYSSVLADAIQRWHRLIDPETDVLFSTGTDEHGMKIQQAAAAKNKQLNKYCSYISEEYKSLFSLYNVDYNKFIRTTNEKHIGAVQHFWTELVDRGHIYSSTYSGWYSVPDESFLTESQLDEITLANGEKALVSKESGHAVEWTEEENYMFKLSNFQQDLIDWLKKNESAVKPKKYYTMLLEWLNESQFPDVSVSRPASRVHWGIPVPENAEQTIYVWLDALVNYLTIAGYPDVNSELFTKAWPPNVQVIGKDILKFHGIYWPAFLMAVDLEPPKMLFCHSHWTVDNEKMSKSKQNIVCPFKQSTVYTAEGLRYFLLREGVAHKDSNYSDTKVVRILNSELADTLGNLLSRCCGNAVNPRQKFPAIHLDALEFLKNDETTQKLIASVETLPDISHQHYSNFNFYKVVDAVIATLHNANLFFETMKPWEMKKDETRQHELNTVLSIAMDTLRVSAIVLQPIIPELTNKLLNKLNINCNERLWTNIHPLIWNDSQKPENDILSDKCILFQRIINKSDSEKQMIRNAKG